MTLSAKLALTRDDFRLDVEFSVAPGISALFGPSGCGKTTVLRCLAGLERAHGRVAVNGTVWQDATQFLPPHRRGVGYVFQEASLLPHLDVRQNLAFAATRAPVAERTLTLNEAADLLGVTRLLDRRTQGLSGGERQRVAIARALLTAPRVLLMDEPLAALDAASKRDLLPYFARLHAHLKIPVVYVSHVFDEIAQVADRMILLDRGSVQAQGAIQELATRFDLPLAHADDAETLIDAEVESCDREFHLAYLMTPMGRITLVRDDLAPGQCVRARIRARDVSIALDAAARSSILNSFRATIAAVAYDRPGSVLLRLDASGVSLLARITHKSASTLQLAAGKTVYAQVKSVALAE